MNSDNAKEYNDIIKFLAESKSDIKFKCSGVIHSSIVISKIFDHSKSIVRIISENFADEVSERPEYLTSLQRFLTNGKKLELLLIDNSKLKVSKAFHTISKTSTLGKADIDVRLLSVSGIERVKQIVGDEQLLYFIVGDGNMYRVETDTSSYNSYASFNDRETAIKLADTFDKYFEDSKTLSIETGEQISNQKSTMKDKVLQKMAANNINFSLEFSDVREFEADILVLKYAQGNYGVDRIVSYDLNQVGKLDLKKISPKVGSFSLIKNVGSTKFENILFVGVPHLDEFGYKEIREFTKDALSILSDEKPNAKHIVMTIHGAGYGLDESEAVISQFAGLFEALQSGDFPKGLEKITIIENDHERLSRLRNVIDNHLEIYKIVSRSDKDWTYTIGLKKLTRVEGNKIIKATKKSETKKHIFVAMPFKDDMNNTFYFGIQQPVNNNDFLCERIDQDIFTGDILTKIKNKIETASAIIADLTTQNPNVYLEVGYAWGIGKPTIFIIEETDSPRFDLQGQRHLKYKKDNLKQLQDNLTKEIKALVDNGEIK